MNKAESKYFNTAVKMDEAFLELLNQKDFEYITVKEICEKAGVNRSTFYLHYETIGDLLNESIEYINHRFATYFSDKSGFDSHRIATADAQELYLITPAYLIPYLAFIRDHARVFQTSVEKAHLLGSEVKFEELFRHIFSPIMSRYHIPEEHQRYLITFYIEGIMGIVKVWLRGGCREEPEEIAHLITDCIRNPFHP